MATEYKSIRSVLDKILEIQGLNTMVELTELLGVDYSVPCRWSKNGLPEGRVDQLFVLGKEIIPIEEIRKFVIRKQVSGQSLSKDVLSEQSFALFEKLIDICKPGIDGHKSIPELAKQIGKAAVTLYTWVHAGECPAHMARIFAGMSNGKYRESDFNPIFNGLVREVGVPDEVDTDVFLDVAPILSDAARNWLKQNGKDDETVRVSFGETISELVGTSRINVYKWSSRSGKVPIEHCKLISDLSGAPLSALNPVFFGMVPEEAA